MNIVEKEANQFYKKLYRNGKVNNLQNLKSFITSKLYDFNRDRDKLDFLKIIRQKSIEDRDEHIKHCSGCGYADERDTGIFAIDQEIDDINRFYTFTPKSEDQFSIKDESELHTKLNEVKEYLKKLDLGQEIIFDEIEDLKNHFNLGKKNWFQLFKGKFFDLVIKKVLDKAIVENIYNKLSEGFDDVVKMIE